MQKGTKIYSILTGTCPVCHQKSMYKHKNPYKIGHTLKMHTHCEHCRTKFKIEPSFFYGAMYVSYAVAVAFAVAAYIIASVFFTLGRLATFLVIVGTLITFIPVIVRLSRNIWVNIFFKYDSKKAS